MRFGPKAQNVIAQGNALGTYEANGQSPKRGEMIKHSVISPFQGFDVRICPNSWGDAPGFHIAPRCGKLQSSTQF